ncbi:MAG: thiamine pyrophosphate-binding protein, partial [Candidatus Nanopelagicales bacterium]|nr:thiamine pyrophosphate-binding protein [Candidatus Nanopelagicales bacterium]
MTDNSAPGVTGAEYVVRALAAEGTTSLFMVPGGHNDPFMTPMTHVDGVQTVVAAHEGGAAYMADGWARATGRTGVAFGIGGPGIFNMVTALASSHADRVPVLAISGEVPVTWEGRGGFQDATTPSLDDVAVTRPVCDVSIRAESSQLLGHHLRTLLLHARNRLAPVHLSIPLDIQRAVVPREWSVLPPAEALRDSQDANATDRLLGVLESPATIAILAGPGVVHGDAAAELVRCAEAWHIPVANTLGAKGVMPEDHPLSVGTFGYAGSRWATDLLLSGAVDVLIVVGSGLSQRDTLQWDRRMLPNRALVHVDADPTLIGRLWPADVPVASAPGPLFASLTSADGSAGRGLAAGRERRIALVDKIKAAGTRDYDEQTRTSRQVPLHPAAVIAAARRALPREAVA